ncbi:MAG: N-acetylglucosamine kinase [Microbacteriaceae bacterium]|nr:N-acetylglucosamine kinase [Microbacteriaceae bacterium]
MSEPVVVAVDGGGSKTDVVAVAQDGTLLAHARGPASNPQVEGLDTAVAVVDALVAEVLASAGRSVLRTAVYLAGLDLPAELAVFRGAVDSMPWAVDAIVDNDMFALLRTGTQEPDAIAVVCGTGINAVGVRADGATARYPALGAITGDWGGGSHFGEKALWHASRAVDGRGPATSFTTTIPRHFGLPDVQAVYEALHFGRLPFSALASLAPVVLDCADAGDRAAISIVDRQAREIVTMVTTAMDRLGLTGRGIPVVLGGGVLASGNRGLLDRVDAGILKHDSGARVSVVRERPIVGATLLALEAVGAGEAALAAARASVVAELATVDSGR